MYRQVKIFITLIARIPIHFRYSRAVVKKFLLIFAYNVKDRRIIDFC